MVRGNWFNIFNKANPKVKTEPDKSRGIIRYGKDNDFPNVLIDKIDDSPTGLACISTFVDFIEGDGISDENIANLIINSDGETFADLHSTVSQESGYFEGVALLFRYNSEYKVSEVIHLPFEACRLSYKDEDTRKVTGVVYNPFYGTKDYKQAQDVCYPLFDPRVEVVSGQVEASIVDDQVTFKGQVYYAKISKPGKRDYPVPDYHAGIEWFEIDAKVGEFHLNNISKNFLLSFILKIVGDPNQKGADNDKTNKELLAADLAENLKGSENAGDAFVVWAKSKDAFPEIESFPNSTNHDLFIAIENIVIDRIARITKVPPILAGIQVSGKLGNTQELVNSIQLLQQRVNKIQRFQERIYKDILSNWKDPIAGDVTIKNINPLNHIPDNLLEALTQQEKRELIEGITGKKLAPLAAPLPEGGQNVA